MKKVHFKSLSLLGLAALGIVGCNGFGKMIKNANQITYAVNPNPLQDNGDSVSVSISAKYPAKFFAKKAVVTITPTLKTSDGKEIALKSMTVAGEKSQGTGVKIAYESGGSLNYSDKVAYQPDMKMDELDVKATLTNKKKDFPAVKIGDGTITTALLIQNDDKLIPAKDHFVKSIPVGDTTHIYYVISQSTVRPTEMKSDEMKGFKTFIETGINSGYVFHGMDVSAWASPDGETDMNQHLADDRAKSAIKAMEGMFKDMEKDISKDKKDTTTKFGTYDGFYKVGTTGIDWDGFKTLTQNSNIKDKDLIIRVLSMYSDHDKRMHEIKNMAGSYPELANQVLPKLRRALIILNAEKKSRSDDQLKVLSVSHPDSLSVEELLYAATLTTDMSQKLTIYKSAEKMYPTDWRCANNAGWAEMAQNKLSDADADFNKANGLSANNPAVLNNMGVVARWKGDRKGALEDFKKAGMTPEVSYNTGLVDIQMGKYADAATNTSAMNTINAALAKLLNGDAAGAKKTLDASNDASGLAFYVRAIIAARNGDKNDMVQNLKSATNKDASLKQSAATDCEFLKYKNDADFKAAIQ